MMTYRKFGFLSTFILAFCLVTAQAMDKQALSTAINLAGKQRMLTQKMSKEILLIAKDIDVEGNKANLKATADLFDKTLKGLANGDAELSLVKTDNESVQAQLAKIDGLWAEFRKNVDAVLGGDTSAEILTKVAEQNLPLLKEMNSAVTLYERAVESDLDPKMASVINHAGRQRMLSQKMTKELLLVAHGIMPEVNAAYLKKTVFKFERVLKGLLDGDEELVLQGTQDEAIRAQLEKVKGIWADYKPILDKMSTADEDLKKAAEINLPLLKEMNTVVKMFEESVK